MATKTLGLTGRDYSTLASWAAYVGALSLSADEICEVYNDGGAVADSTTVTVGGWTANGFSVTVRPAAGQGLRHNANRLTNAYRYNASNGAALTNSVGYAAAYILSGANLVVEDLQMQATSSTAANVVQPSNGAVVRRTVLRKSAAGNYVVGQAQASTFEDSLLLHVNGSAFQATGDNINIDGCTLATVSAGSTGIVQAYAAATPPRVRNTVFVGFSTATQNSYRTGSTNNATTTATWGGTGISGTTSLTAADQFEALGSGSEDFRLKSSADGGMKAGGAAGVGSGFDGVATARNGSTPSIGAWEAGGPTGPTITDHPENASVTAGAPAVFSVSATGAGTLLYQWQIDEGSGPEDLSDTGPVSGATTDETTIDPTTLEMDGLLFRVAVTDDGGTVYSDWATLNVSVPQATALRVRCSALASASGYRGVVLSTAAPGATSEVIAGSDSITFDGGGYYDFDVTGLGVESGAYRWVDVTNSDGTADQDPAPNGFQGLGIGVA